MKPLNTLTLLSAALLLSACGGEGDKTQARGPDPKLPEQQSSLLPSMKIAEPTPWGEQKPKVPEGYSVTAIAKDLAIPRQTLVLPNGDILVAEGRGGSAAKLKPKDVIASVIKAQGNTQVKGGNRITLLRDADGDGTYELKTVFADNLNAPYGLAFADGKLYVANQDALVRFDYADGQTKASAPPVKVTDLPAQINHHWTKSLAVSEDGRQLYVGIGSIQQHHRTRHGSGDRPCDGLADRRGHRRAQTLRHGPAQPDGVDHPTGFRATVDGSQRAR